MRKRGDGGGGERERGRDGHFNNTQTASLMEDHTVV